MSLVLLSTSNFELITFIDVCMLILIVFFRSPSLFSLIDILCQQTKAESQSEEENSQGSSVG